MTYSPILVGVDGSRASSAAIRYAAHEALRLGAPLRLVHVLAEFIPMAPMAPLMPSDLEDTGRAILARAVDEACALLPTDQVSSSLIGGPRVRALVQVAKDARLIAFGHERRPTIDRLLTGATVTGVAAAAACPVVAVAPEWSAAAEHGCVLVGVKSLDDSSHLLRRAFETAAERGARLLVVHAWELPAEYDDLITTRVDLVAWQDRATHAIDRAIATFQDAYPEVKVEVRVVHGQAAHTLRAASEVADLVCLPDVRERSPSGTSAGRRGPCCDTAAAPSQSSLRPASPSASSTWCWSTTGALEK